MMVSRKRDAHMRPRSDTYFGASIDKPTAPVSSDHHIHCTAICYAIATSLTNALEEEQTRS